MSCVAGRLEPPKGSGYERAEGGRDTEGDWNGTKWKEMGGLRNGGKIGIQIRIWREVCPRHRVCVAVLKHASLQACSHASNRERPTARRGLARTPPSVRSRAEARVAADRLPKAHPAVHPCATYVYVICKCGNRGPRRGEPRTGNLWSGTIGGGLANNNPYYIYRQLQRLLVVSRTVAGLHLHRACWKAPYLLNDCGHTTRLSEVANAQPQDV